MIWRARPLTFVNARVLCGDGRVARTVRIQRAHVDGVDVAPGRDDLVVDLDEALVVPGLVNAHDHLELNSFARMKWRARHVNVREWIADFQPRFGTDPALAAATADTLVDRLWVGGLKNLLAGVTTVCHHNPWHRTLGGRFPTRVVRRYRFSHSLQIDGDGVAQACQRTPEGWPWIIHAAEGVDDEAAGEVRALARLGCLTPRTVLVHGVGMDARDRAVALESGASLVWCPSSNTFLFDRTADVRAFDDAGRLAIGSDSRLSADGDLLDELRAAQAARQVSAEGLFRAVTSGAADVLRLGGAGRLRPGGPADLAVVSPLHPDPYETLPEATRADVRLVLIDGQPRVGEPCLRGVFEHTGVPVEAATVDGQPRLLARDLARRAAALALPEPGLQVLA